MSAVAEGAGVPRSTLYRHFPDEGSLFEACSSHWAALNPPPDLSAWAAIGHALAFTTWRSLVREQGLGRAQAIDLICELIVGAGERAPAAR